MHRIMNWLMIALGVVGGFLIAFQWITLMNLLAICLGFVSAVLMIVSSVRSYRRGNRLALYVFFGFTLLAFVPLVYLIPVPNYLHYRSDESDLQYLGEAIRSIIFSVGIAHRFYLLKQQVAKHEIEKKELALAQEQQLKDEKERISRDLHDNIGAELAILSMELWQASKLYPDDPGINSALVTSGSIYNQLRDTIWAIEKNHVKLEDLESRLRVLLWKQGQAHTSVQFDLTTGTADSQFLLTPTQSINLFRIVQEAVQNAVTHSACTNIKVGIHFNSPGALLVEIVDNGKGFNPGRNGHHGDIHYGLRNMKRRALEVQGEIIIVSNDLQGTSVALSFPVVVSR
jgi:signal transduction histidine kinase